MKLDGRVRKLESEFLGTPVILHFVDGSTRELRGSKLFLLDLMIAAGRRANRTAVQAEQLQLIRDSVWADEPGGGHMVELVKVMLAAAETTCTAELEAEYLKCDG